MTRITVAEAAAALMAGMLTGASPAHAKGAVMDSALAAVDHIVEQVRSAPRLDRRTVEHIVGAPLRRASTTRFFEISESEGVRAGGLALRAELREPIPGSGATAGPLLIVRIASGCASRKAVADHFGPWQVADVPRGRSPDEQASWSREEPWGKLSFGFAESAPDCLRTVTFDAKRAG